jgi:xylose isomerase
MHFGTGNYNETTARTYGDISLFTCDEQLGSDAVHLFNAITGLSVPQSMGKIAAAPINLRETTLAMYYILKGGGFKNGGSNFDAKVRRQSCDADDLFHGHIGGMDLLARALINAADMIETATLQAFKDKRYAGWKNGVGADMLAGKASLDDVAADALKRNTSPAPVSGRQEMLENYISNAVK